MHCITALVSPASMLYRLGPRRPSLKVKFHWLVAQLEAQVQIGADRRIVVLKDCLG
jgi:hypothetical protein